MIDKGPQNPSLLTGPPSAPDRPRVPRWTWVLLMLLAACIVGGVAGLLSHAAGDNIPAAILTGGGAYAGTIGVLLALAHYTQSDRDCGDRSGGAGAATRPSATSNCGRSCRSGSDRS